MPNRKAITVCIFAAAAASIIACSDKNTPPDRVEGEAAIRKSCVEGKSMQIDRALAYLQYVRQQAPPGELSHFIGESTLQSCLNSERESPVRGQVSLVLLEKGADGEVKNYIQQMTSPSMFCRHSAAAYGNAAQIRISTVCKRLGLPN